MKKFVCAVALLCCALAVTGCPKPHEELPNLPAKDYEAALPPGELALRKITDPAQIPDFTAALRDTSTLRESLDYSLEYLAKPSSTAGYPYGDVPHDRVVASLKAFRAIIDSGQSASQMNETLRQRFDVYQSVGCDQHGTVLFTCYYTPIFSASLTKTDKFRYPLYKQPADMVKMADGSPKVPMPDRKAIESSDMFAGQELAWLADPFEVYVAHIQGSVRLRLEGGKELTAGYAANNGHEYKSVRAELVKDNKIGKRDGLPAMLTYFRQHAAEVQAYTWRNPRFIFFQGIEDGHPRGCLNEPVTPRRTIATDKTIFPRAGLALLTTSMPTRRAGGAIEEVPVSTFALDQDSGGAIRAPGRCDLYLGIGDEAGELAGRAQNEGKLYYVFLKPEMTGIAPPKM
jgi:membrane-bound lytic murein transglycosylase A